MLSILNLIITSISLFAFLNLFFKLINLKVDSVFLLIFLSLIVSFICYFKTKNKKLNNLNFFLFILNGLIFATPFIATLVIIFGLLIGLAPQNN